MPSIEEVVAELTGGSTPAAGTPEPDEKSTPAEEKVEAAPTSDEPQAAESVVEEKESSEAKPAEGRSPAFDKLLAKFNGDYDKLANGIFEQYNSTSRLYEKLEQLEQRLTSKVESEPEEKLEHPDLPILNQQITALDAKGKENENRRLGILNEVQSINIQLAKLEGQLEKADDFDKARIEAKMGNLANRRESLADKWHQLGDLNERYERDKFDLQRQVRNAERELEAARAQRKTAEAEQQSFRAQTLNEFATGVDTAAAKYGIDKDSPVYQHMYNVIRAEASLYLRNLPEGAPAIDINAFAQARADVYAQTMGVSKKQAFQKVSQEKIKATTTGKVIPQETALGRRVAAASANTPTPQFRTAKESKEWAAKVLG